MRDPGAAAALIESPPEYEYFDGMFYVVDGAAFRAMRPNVFFKAFKGAAKAIQDYHATEGAEIIPFREDARAAH